MIFVDLQLAFLALNFRNSCENGPFLLCLSLIECSFAEIKHVEEMDILLSHLVITL